MAQTVSFGPKALSDTLLSKLNAPGGANTGISKLGNQLKYKHGLCTVRYQEIEAASATNLKNNYTVAVGRVTSLDSLGIGQMDALPRTIKFSYNSGVAFDIDITVKGMGYDRIDQEQTVSLTIAGSVSDTVETEMPFLGENLDITIAAGGGGLGAGTINIGTGNGVALPIPTSDQSPLVVINLTDDEHFVPGSQTAEVNPAPIDFTAFNVAGTAATEVLTYTFPRAGYIKRIYGMCSVLCATGAAVEAHSIVPKIGGVAVQTTGPADYTMKPWVASTSWAVGVAEDDLAIVSGNTFRAGDTLTLDTLSVADLTAGVFNVVVEVVYFNPMATINVPSAVADKAKPGCYSFVPPVGSEWDGSTSFDILYRPDETYMTAGLESLQHISENWSEYA